MKPYLWTFAALVALTFLTLGLSYVPMGAFGIPAALLIALAKAVLVVLFFMHLREQRVSSRVTIVVATLLAGVAVTLAALDVASRHLPLGG